MNTNGYLIRLEEKQEQRQTENLVREAFWNVYRPGCLEHYLLHVLRKAPVFIPELNFVMEMDGKLIGQAAFVHGKIAGDDGRDIPVLTLGPICIATAYQRQGYGKILLDYALEKAAAFGGMVCLEGNIDFYGKSGFVPASRFGLRYAGMPVGEDAFFFLCRMLQADYLAGRTGVYGPPEVYFVEEAPAEEFDRNFPKKEKLKLPGQLF